MKQKKLIIGTISCISLFGMITINASAVTGGIASKSFLERITKTTDSTSENSIMSGQYKVGTDIKSGEYMLFCDGYGYFCVSSDSNANDIIQNGNFSYNSIIKIEDGQFFEIKRCYAVPLSDVDVEDLDFSGEGMFKVGEHIPAGEYKLNCTSDLMGYYCVYSDASQQNIIANNNFEGSSYVTVANGEYLQLARCAFDEIPKIPERVYSDKETVVKVQEYLNLLGYSCGDADGLIGEKTRNAVKQYQSDTGLNADGEINEELINNLFSQ